MLYTNRCKLMEIQQSDYDDVKELYLDDEVRKFLGGAVEEKYCVVKFNEMLELKNSHWYWVIRNKESMEFIGLISLDTHVDGIGTEISYQLLPKWWRKGYGKETVNKVLEYAFEELRLNIVVAETQSANVQSCKLLESLGMNLENRVVRFGAEQNIYCLRGSHKSAGSTSLYWERSLGKEVYLSSLP